MLRFLLKAGALAAAAGLALHFVKEEEEKRKADNIPVTPARPVVHPVNAGSEPETEKAETVSVQTESSHEAGSDHVQQEADQSEATDQSEAAEESSCLPAKVASAEVIPFEEANPPEVLQEKDENEKA